MKCSRCGADYQSASAQVWCTACTTEYCREWRARRRAQGIPVNNWTDEKKREYSREWQKSAEEREKRRQRAAVYRARHKEKVKARSALGQAIQRGEIKRGACEKCSEPKAEAHHDDYSRPLDVRWLCVRHHVEEHIRDR
jgi:hypothetical protein